MDGTNDLLCVCEDGTALVYPFTTQNLEHELLFSTGNERHALPLLMRRFPSNHEPGKVGARIAPQPVSLFSAYGEFSRFVTWLRLDEQTVVSKVERRVGADGKAGDVLALFSLSTKRISCIPCCSPYSTDHEEFALAEEVLSCTPARSGSPALLLEFVSGAVSRFDLGILSFTPFAASYLLCHQQPTASRRSSPSLSPAPSSETRAYGVPLLPPCAAWSHAFGVHAQVGLLGLSTRNRLYLAGVLIRERVSSFAANEHFLLFLTFDNVL